jgi:hypothetical protein
MKTKMMIGCALACAVAIMPAAAPAQFGGLKKLGGVMGGGGSPGVSATDAEGFLTGATRSTKNVMISAALLAQAVTDQSKLTGRKAEIEALANVQDIKELDAHRDTLSSDLAVLNGRADLAGDLSKAYDAGNAQQKKAISMAVANLAIGILRNTELAGQAPTMVKGIGSNPALMTRVGQFKMAAGLLGLQAKGLSGVATSMPKLLTAAKVKGPAASETSEPQPIAI